MGARIAFGPFLALAMLEFLFFGDTLLDHYLRWVH
jgi:prepilin signal peptidase PulO-like enzyme (type II secretory pathway)